MSPRQPPDIDLLPIYVCCPYTTRSAVLMHKALLTRAQVSSLTQFYAPNHTDMHQTITSFYSKTFLE